MHPHEKLEMKEDSVHNRRIVAKLIQDKEILAKLFTEIAPGFVDRPGGYTRILKLGYRKGDAAEMVLLELVGREELMKRMQKKADELIISYEGERKKRSKFQYDIGVQAKRGYAQTSLERLSPHSQ